MKNNFWVHRGEEGKGRVEIGALGSRGREAAGPRRLGLLQHSQEAGCQGREHASHSPSQVWERASEVGRAGMFYTLVSVLSRAFPYLHQQTLAVLEV